MSPKVSFITSLFREKDAYLRLFLDSCLNQTFSDWELILVDDGASPENLSLLGTYSDPRIRVIKNEVNLGLTKSLNRAAKVARGEFLARLDTDDYNFPERLEKQVKFFESHPDYVLCGCMTLEDFGQGPRAQETRFLETNDELRKALPLFNPFIHSSLMFPKKVFEAIGGYNEYFKYSQDYQLVFRLMQKGKVHNLPDTLVVRHMGANQISMKKQREQTYYALCTKAQSLGSLGLSPQGCLSVAKTGTKLLFLAVLGKSTTDRVKQFLKGES